MIRPNCLILLGLWLCNSIWAFPQAAQHDSRDLLGLPGLVDGLLGSVASLVDPNDRRPDAAHPYQAPGPTDQRGPCPGMNILANHGYLPRSGIITAGQAIQASVDVFNMGIDIATGLTTMSVITSGNLMTGVLSIGGEDDRTYSASGLGSKAAGRQWGLDAHSRVEADASPTRADFFLNNGDSHSGDGSRFARFVKLAAAHGGQFTVEAANELYGQNIQISMTQNPRLFQSSYTIIATLGTHPFITYMFSNGTYGHGGVANYESISTILGFKLDHSTGKFCYVPERFPEIWYRRATPYTLADLAANLAPTFLSGPPTAPNPLGALLTNPDQLPQLECVVYQAMFSVVPAALVGESAERIAAAVSYVQTALLPLIPATLGCPININGTAGNVTPETQDSLQETGPGGGQAYNTCSAT